MKAVVISDTHIKGKGRMVPKAVLSAAQSADLIIHAGDINRDYVIYELEEFAPVEAVAGNTDDEYVESMLGRKKVISFGNYKIGLIHGDGGRGTTYGRVKTAFEGENLDCVVFGHSHIPYNEVEGGVLYFNPGSPTHKRRQKYFSFVILTADEHGIAGEIVYFDRD